MKIVLFDLGKTLEDRGLLLPGAHDTLQAIQAMQGPGREVAVLALVSDFNMPTRPEQIPTLQQQYYEILDQLGIRSFFEPVAERVTLSTAVGVVKPDERIFRAVIAKINAGLCFQDVIFITENRTHVVAAHHLGMRALHFKGPGQQTGDVDRLVHLVPLIEEFLEDSPSSRQLHRSRGRSPHVVN
jgi:FMN phosphatase YigB (HAD superfamily)